MKITVEFDNEDEFEAFRTSGKKTRARGSKDDTNEGNPAGTSPGNAPAPMQPPTGGSPDMSGMGAQQGGFPGAGSGFPSASTGPSPEVAALVARINAKTDAAVASGQNAEQARAWLAGQCGAEAANATLDQIKTVYLAKLPVPQLTNIAGLMAA